MDSEEAHHAERLEAILVQAGRIEGILAQMRSAQRYVTESYPFGGQIVDYGAASRAPTTESRPLPPPDRPQE